MTLPPTHFIPRHGSKCLSLDENGISSKTKRKLMFSERKEGREGGREGGRKEGHLGWEISPLISYSPVGWV